MRVSDPSTASAIVNVIVTITEVNEPPAFHDDAPTLLSVVEKVNEDPPDIKIEHSGDIYSMLIPIAVMPTRTGSVSGTLTVMTTPIYTYSVSGADGDDFLVRQRHTWLS